MPGHATRDEAPPTVLLADSFKGGESLNNRFGLRFFAAPLIAIALVATACGSTDNANKASGGGSDATPQAGAGGAGDFCAVLRDELNGLNSAFPKDFGSADQLKAYGAYVEQSNAKLVATAPAEIKDAIQTQARVSNAQAASYKNGVKPPRELSAQLRTPEFQAAAQKVAAYAKDKCGISPSPPAG